MSFFLGHPVYLQSTLLGFTASFVGVAPADGLVGVASVVGLAGVTPAAGLVGVALGACLVGVDAGEDEAETDGDL